MLGWLIDRLVEDAAEKAIRRHFDSPKFKAKLSKIVAETPIIKFMKAMQFRYLDRAPDLTMEQAWEHARINLVDFLKGDKSEFGDPRYDWTADGARDLVDVDMSYWEVA